MERGMDRCLNRKTFRRTHQTLSLTSCSLADLLPSIVLLIVALIVACTLFIFATRAGGFGKASLSASGQTGVASKWYLVAEAQLPAHLRTLIPPLQMVPGGLTSHGGLSEGASPPSPAAGLEP